MMTVDLAVVRLFVPLAPIVPIVGPVHALSLRQAISALRLFRNQRPRPCQLQTLDTTRRQRVVLVSICALIDVVAVTKLMWLGCSSGSRKSFSAGQCTSHAHQSMTLPGICILCVALGARREGSGS